MLSKEGFYKHERTGSKLFRELEKKAKLEYIEALRKKEASVVEILESKSAKSAKKIDDILVSPFNIEDLSDAMKRPSDPENWLNISQQEVDDIISKKQRDLEKAKKYTKKEDDEDDMHDDDDANVDENNLFDFIVKGMKQFGQKISSYEGAEMPGE